MAEAPVWCRQKSRLMEAIHFIQDLAIILAVAGAAGWLCQRLGLSAVVGYLGAGVVVGPFAPPLSLVTDIPRIEVLAQLGLVFLMFSIGLRLSLRRLQRLGLGIVLTVVTSAGLIFMFTRLTGAALGLGGSQILFLASMLMVSSSAIVMKVLIDLNATHERSGQMAMGLSVMEDVVAVVMLTLLNSLVHFGAASKVARVGETLGMMSAFVVLAGVTGMIIVPWLLRRMSASANEELQTLGLGGMLFGLAVVAQKAGYSTALGAFLLGTIVADTPHRAQVERLFEGMRDIFCAVFFVAIGMQIEPQLLWAEAVPIFALTVFALGVRTVACTAGFLIIGTPIKDALRSGLMVLPIGEFTFIIAQFGVISGVLEPRYYPIAVGLSLLTAFGAPLIARHSEGISNAVVDRQPRWLLQALEDYRAWVDRVSQLRQRNILWQLSRKRLIQIGVGVLFVTGLFVFAEKLADTIDGWLGADRILEGGRRMLFWGALTLIALPPLVAIWRNIGAMAILYAEVSSRGQTREKRGGKRGTGDGGQAREAKVRLFVEHGLKVLAGIALFVWLASIVPIGGMGPWIPLVLLVVTVLALIVLRRKFIYWHSEIEVELMSVFEGGPPAAMGSQTSWLSSHKDWELVVVDCVLPDLAECRGHTIESLGLRQRFGATVVGVERQGYLLSLPGPLEILYPRDKVLLLGSPAQISAVSEFLRRVSVERQEESLLDEIRMEKFVVPTNALCVGQTLAEIASPARFGVQLAGLLRDGTKTLNPSATERLQVNDELLCLGVSHQLKAFSKWLNKEQSVGPE